MIGECARLARIVNSAMVGLTVVVAAVIVYGVLGASPDPGVLALAFVTATAIAASAMILNDIVDVEIDRVNAPWRPLVRGAISTRAAWACFAASTLIGLAAAAATGAETLVLAAAAWALGVVYDLWGKKSGLPGNVMVAFATSMPFLYAMALARCFCSDVAIFWAIVFLTVLAREIAKDIADVEGDKLAGARTLPVIAGPRRAAATAAVLYLAAVALSPIPALSGRVNVLVYAALVAAVDALLVYESLRLLRDHSKEAVLRHKRNVLLAMLLGLLAFLAGALA